MYKPIDAVVESQITSPAYLTIIHSSTRTTLLSCEGGYKSQAEMSTSLSICSFRRIDDDPVLNNGCPGEQGLDLVLRAAQRERGCLDVALERPLLRDGVLDIEH